MIKTAIFVENCFNLFNKNTLSSTEYNFPNASANQFFMIVNVGNDNAVLSRLLEREANLFKQGYTKIVALRDMYSNAYRKLVKDHTIKQEVNKRFIQLTNEEISERASSPENIHFQYAIMEIETWLWGLAKVFQKIDSKLTNEYIEKQTGFNLDDDPETLLFHPSKLLSELLHSVGKSYDKSKGDVSNFESHTEKRDYEILLQSDKCRAFSSFVNAIKK